VGPRTPRWAAHAALPLAGAHRPPAVPTPCSDLGDDPLSWAKLKELPQAGAQ
ncbi:hypothetical protein S245_033919, partial [Arachis hypogaea]